VSKNVDAPVLPQWLAPGAADVRSSAYCGREDGFCAVDGLGDGLSGAALAGGSLGSAAMMLIGGIDDDDG
jgi:hypothetical protein